MANYDYPGPCFSCGTEECFVDEAVLVTEPLSHEEASARDHNDLEFHLP